MEPFWLSIARRELYTGVKEISGDEDNPRILTYHTATSLAATSDEVPWCSSFINWCIRETQTLPGTNSARARSWLNWGKHMGDVHIPHGAIVIFQRGGGDQPGPEVIAAPGHVGLYEGRTGLGEILVLGGNQGNAVSVRPYPASRLLGVRWPA